MRQKHTICVGSQLNCHRRLSLLSFALQHEPLQKTAAVQLKQRLPQDTKMMKGRDLLRPSSILANLFEASAAKAKSHLGQSYLGQAH